MSFLSFLRFKIQTYTSLPYVSLLRYQRRIANNNDFVILCYHRVRERTGIFYDNNISASSLEFRKQMLYINKHFNVISIDQLTEHSKGNSKLKPNSIMITFDDGYKDNAINAFPVLEELCMSAVVFVTTGYIDSDSIPWEDQVSYLFSKISAKKVEIEDKRVYPLETQDQKEKINLALLQEVEFVYSCQAK